MTDTSLNTCIMKGACYAQQFIKTIKMSSEKGKVNPYIRTRLWHDRLVFDPESTLERLAKYVVTAHIHDNGGFSDEHKMPGTGTVDWKSTIPRLLACPNLEFVQNEADWRRDGLSIPEVVAGFARLFG